MVLRVTNCRWALLSASGMNADQWQEHVVEGIANKQQHELVRDWFPIQPP